MTTKPKNQNNPKRDPSALVMLVSICHKDLEDRRVQYHLDILTARALNKRCTVLAPTIQLYQMEVQVSILTPLLLQKDCIDAVFIDRKDNSLWSASDEDSFKTFYSFEDLDKWIEGRLSDETN